MPVKLQSSSGGSVTLDVPVTASNYNLTVPAASGTAMVSGNMPVFSAYLSGYQGGVSQSTWTKVSLNAEYYDTNSNFNTSTYKFTPTVAGYYQINAGVLFDSTVICNSPFFLYLYKGKQHLLIFS